MEELPVLLGRHLADNVRCLSEKDRAAMRAEIKRTGVSVLKLFDEATDVPEGLTARCVNRWLGKIVRQAPQAHFDYVMRCWAALEADHGRYDSNGERRMPSGRRWPREGELWIEVTEGMANELRVEMARTGLDTFAALALLSEANGLTARRIRAWLYREVRTTNAEHWTLVMDALRAAPNREVC